MSRWLYLVVSCTAAIGIACGGDGEKKDAGADGGGVTADARPPADAAPIDSRLPDAAPPPPDARPDAAPQIDAPPVPDGGPDAPVCPTNACTGKSKGMHCVDTDTEIECDIVNGCPVVATAATDCGARQSCTDNTGCFCDVAKGHDTASCPDGAGKYCSGNSTVTCDEDAFGCFFTTGEEENCSKPEGDPPVPTSPRVCSDDEDDSPGSATCACPAAGGNTGGGCTTINSRKCSDDGNDVLVCVLIDGCMVWDNGDLVPDAANPGDNCAADGLTCNNVQCQCPRNDTSDYHTNGNPDVAARRLLRPQLLQNGNKFPATCSFENPSLALANALAANGPGHSNKARVIIDHCDDDGAVIRGATGECKPVLFSNQTAGLQGPDQFPWHVPRNVEVITDEEPAAGGNGDVDGYHPDNYVVMVQKFTGPNVEGFKAAVNVSDTGKLSGFTLIEGGCDGDDNDNGETDTHCSVRKGNEFFPNVMVQILDLDGFRSGIGGPSEAHIEHMHISGAGGPTGTGELDNELAGPQTGGTFTFDAATGLVTFILAADNPVILEANSPGSRFVAFYASGGNTGAWGPVRAVKSSPTGSIDSLQWYNPKGAAGAPNGPWFFGTVGTIDVGILVSRDDQNGFARDEHGLMDDATGPEDFKFGDTNAVLKDVFISHFSTWDGGANIGPPLQTLAIGHNSQRIGALIDDDFVSSTPREADVIDHVRFEGGLLLVNNTGMAITDGHVELDGLEVDWSTGQGIEVNDEIPTLDGGCADKLPGGPVPGDAFYPGLCAHDDTNVQANDIFVHNTQLRDAFVSPVSNSMNAELDDENDDLNGNGVNVTGRGSAMEVELDEDDDVIYEDVGYTLELTNSQIVFNEIDGLAIVSYHPNDEAVVTATSNELSDNGENGVNLGNGRFSPFWGDVRDYGSKTTLTTNKINRNGLNGVFSEVNNDGTAEDFDTDDIIEGSNTLSILGGEINNNGLDIGSFIYYLRDPVQEVALERVGCGILAVGNATVITDKGPGDGGPRLAVTQNGIAGLTANDGHLILNHTDFDANGVNNLCDEENDEDGHGWGGGITRAARATITDCHFNTNEGAGLIIDDDLESPFAKQGAKPQTLLAFQSNTINAGQFNGNLGKWEDCGDDAERPFPTDGLEITPEGKAFLVGGDAGHSTISGNAKNGADIAGQLPFAPADVGENSFLEADTNGIDGVVVSCHQNEDWNVDLINCIYGDDANEGFGGCFPIIIKALAAKPILPDFFRVCGFAQLEGGSSHDNVGNGVRVNGNLYWQEGELAGNHENGAVVDHADVYTNVGETDVTNEDGPSYAFGYYEGALPPGADDAYPVDNGDGYQAPVRSRFIGMDVNNNVMDGYRVLAAPWANQAPSGGATPNVCDFPYFDSTNGVEGLDGDTVDIESTRPLCDTIPGQNTGPEDGGWGFEISAGGLNQGIKGTINNNGGWAVNIGSTTQAQNIYATVGDAQIFQNGGAPSVTAPGGIFAVQNVKYGNVGACARGADAEPIRCQCDGSADDNSTDTTVGCTATTILSNNIYGNAGAGTYIKRGFQKALGYVDRRTVSANDTHHNAVTPADQCSVALADEFQSQMVWDGRIGQTDDSVTVTPQNQANCTVNPTNGSCVPCGPALPNSVDGASTQCIGPNSNYEADYRCFWGLDDGLPLADVEDNGVASERNDSQAECLAMNNPNSPESDGVNNHCLWNGTQCRIAWDMGGREGVEACDSSRNRIFAYVNDQNEDPFGQKGVAATNGAYVRARRNIWGSGGAVNGIFENSIGNSRVDPNDDCGSISTCP